MPPIIHYGVAHPWLCDALGHLNTRNYHAMYDDALFVLLAIIGQSNIVIGQNISVHQDAPNALINTIWILYIDMVMASLKLIGNRIT